MRWVAKIRCTCPGLTWSHWLAKLWRKCEMNWTPRFWLICWMQRNRSTQTVYRDWRFSFWCVTESFHTTVIVQEWNVARSGAADWPFLATNNAVVGNSVSYLFLAVNESVCRRPDRLSHHWCASEELVNTDAWSESHSERWKTSFQNGDNLNNLWRPLKCLTACRRLPLFSSFFPKWKWLNGPFFQPKHEKGSVRLHVVLVLWHVSDIPLKVAVTAPGWCSALEPCQKMLSGGLWSLADGCPAKGKSAELAAAVRNACA